MAIRSFRDKRLKSLFDLRIPKGFPADLALAVRRKLAMLDAAEVLDDLRRPPANRLEALRVTAPASMPYVSTISSASALSGHPKDRPMSSSWTTTDGEAVLTLAPLHPGEVLREEFLKPLGLSPGAVARAIGVPRTRIERLAGEQVDLTPDTALRLARLLGTTAQFWMNLQARYALQTAQASIGVDLARIEPIKLAS